MMVIFYPAKAYDKTERSCYAIKGREVHRGEEYLVLLWQEQRVLSPPTGLVSG